MSSKSQQATNIILDLLYMVIKQSFVSVFPNVISDEKCVHSGQVPQSLRMTKMYYIPLILSVNLIRSVSMSAVRYLNEVYKQCFQNFENVFRKLQEVFTLI